MDPVTLILSALTAGATASLKETTNQAVKDAYQGLKDLVKKKFTGKPAAEMALTEHEKKPDIWKAPLEEELKELGIDQEQDVIIAAQQLMELIQPQQVAKINYYNQIIGNVQGIAQGDYQQVTMNFGEPSNGK